MTEHRRRREAGLYEPPQVAGGAASGLDGLNKEQLLQLAKDEGASPANNAMSKDELRASIEANRAEG